MLTNASPRQRDTHILAAAGRFGRFGPEEEKAVRLPEIAQDKRLGDILAAWKEFVWRDIKPTANPLQISDELPAGLECSAKDVEALSIHLAELQGEKDFESKSGAFLSALIKRSRDMDFIIHTSHLQKLVRFIGVMNTKNIIVEGNTGIFSAGGMISGTLLINGNAGNLAGTSMEGGILTIAGDAQQIALDMKGGEIHLENASVVIDYQKIKGGKIFHKGVQIWPEGGGSE
jgi:hypothetical protein